MQQSKPKIYDVLTVHRATGKEQRIRVHGCAFSADATAAFARHCGDSIDDFVFSAPLPANVNIRADIELKTDPSTPAVFASQTPSPSTSPLIPEISGAALYDLGPRAKAEIRSAVWQGILIAWVLIGVITATIYMMLIGIGVFVVTS